ncbi:DUF89 domain-containing protein [Rickenella mellea]|uniref:Sugar phosphate phosphatase n=1 Tax=Rickenella mellea TaxID=50990 RepID=A0A4Y7QJ78_9AGAM|nr:DUF89 domain-containing protein [Rickenella mellea]
MSYFQAPYPPYDPTDKSGYETVVKRWPVILTTVIDNIHRTNHDVTLSGNKDTGALADRNDSLEGLDENAKERVAEGKHLIELVSKLKYEMGRDRPLVQIPDDGESGVEDYNTELRKLTEEENGTWFTAPWLFAECYLYRLLRAWFAQTKHWRDHDPFFASKEDSFKGSSDAVFKLASTMRDLEARKDELEADHEKIGVLFKEMIQMSLWYDLSLLTNLTQEDIRKLQSVGNDAHAERKEFVLRDDADAVWSHLRTMRDGRADFVLDNSGFELYTDLVFADFLVTYTPYVSKVVFHPKAMPWFVSDVTPPDFKHTFSSILSPSFFPPPSPTSPSTNSASDLHHMVTRWKTHLSTGAFSLSVPVDTPLGASNLQTDFWTAPHAYWDMKLRAAELFEALSGSGLVIFKVTFSCLLTGDVRWPASTPFETAIGPLSGAFPILSLRTSKADVVVGVDQAKADALDASGEKWRVNGKYALVSFCPRKS